MANSPTMGLQGLMAASRSGPNAMHRAINHVNKHYGGLASLAQGYAQQTGTHPQHVMDHIHNAIGVSGLKDGGVAHFDDGGYTDNMFSGDDPGTVDAIFNPSSSGYSDTMYNGGSNTSSDSSNSDNSGSTDSTSETAKTPYLNPTAMRRMATAFDRQQQQAQQQQENMAGNALRLSQGRSGSGGGATARHPRAAWATLPSLMMTPDMSPQALQSYNMTTGLSGYAQGGGVQYFESGDEVGDPGSFHPEMLDDEQGYMQDDRGVPPDNSNPDIDWSREQPSKIGPVFESFGDFKKRTNSSKNPDTYTPSPPDDAAPGALAPPPQLDEGDTGKGGPMPLSAISGAAERLGHFLGRPDLVDSSLANEPGAGPYKNSAPQYSSPIGPMQSNSQDFNSPPSVGQDSNSDFTQGGGLNYQANPPQLAVPLGNDYSPPPPISAITRAASKPPSQQVVNKPPSAAPPVDTPADVLAGNPSTHDLMNAGGITHDQKNGVINVDPTPKDAQGAQAITTGVQVAAKNGMLSPQELAHPQVQAAAAGQPTRWGAKDPIWDKLFYIGAATMAGTSPFALTNLGQGIMQGMQAYNQQQNQQSERDLRQAQIPNLQAETQLHGAQAQQLKQQMAFDNNIFGAITSNPRIAQFLPAGVPMPPGTPSTVPTPGGSSVTSGGGGVAPVGPVIDPTTGVSQQVTQIKGNVDPQTGTVTANGKPIVNLNDMYQAAGMMQMSSKFKDFGNHLQQQADTFFKEGAILTPDGVKVTLPGSDVVMLKQDLAKKGILEQNGQYNMAGAQAYAQAEGMNAGAKAEAEVGPHVRQQQLTGEIADRLAGIALKNQQTLEAQTHNQQLKYQTQIPNSGGGYSFPLLGQGANGGVGPYASSGQSVPSKEIQKPQGSAADLGYKVPPPDPSKVISDPIQPSMMGGIAKDSSLDKQNDTENKLISAAKDEVKPARQMVNNANEILDAYQRIRGGITQDTRTEAGRILRGLGVSKETVDNLLGSTSDAQEVSKRFMNTALMNLKSMNQGREPGFMQSAYAQKGSPNENMEPEAAIALTAQIKNNALGTIAQAANADQYIKRHGGVAVGYQTFFDDNWGQDYQKAASEEAQKYIGLHNAAFPQSGFTGAGGASSAAIPRMPPISDPVIQGSIGKPSSLGEGRTAFGGKMIVKGGVWQMNQ